jgi:hypothetical protein
MSNTFASGRHAFGFCDVCGQRYPLAELKHVVVKQKITGTKACPECWDVDHPQLMLGTFPVYDPQALREPRVDVNRNVSNTLTLTIGQLSPPTIGATVGLVGGSALGTVTVFIH